jgi:hypothetical protein
VHATFTAHGSSVTLSLPWTLPYHGELGLWRFVAFGTLERHSRAGHHASAPSDRMRSSLHAVVSPLVTACYPYWSRTPSGDRPHVSLSWALPQAFASWGILRRVTYGGHLLRGSTASESTPAVTSFLLTVSWSRRATLSTGFRGSEHWSLYATPAPSLSRFGQAAQSAWACSA